ncbi:MAG TPA: type II secretion system protein GspE, partial [Gammaproteobacteria bacterium]|nr:type II secretion system protein GspE [Gammaproteobacteria bacterium]
LCSACKTSRPANPAEREYLGLAENSIVHQQQGCPHCNHLGFRGRTGIYELIVIDDRMREMIHD